MRHEAQFCRGKTKVNRGEVEQYFVENSHPAIFSRELAALLDMERGRRQRLGKSYNGAGIFSSRIVCGDCGGIYGPKVWYHLALQPQVRSG